MNRKTTWIGAGGVFTALAICVALAELGPASHGRRAPRVILPDQVSYTYYHSGYWPVSRDEALAADQGVRGYLLTTQPSYAPKLDTFYGQIIGYESAGRRLVHLNYVCPEAARAFDGTSRSATLRSMVSPAWKKTIVEDVEDGECRFSVDFDPATGSYENLSLRFLTPST